jgi:hypothetical protein
MSLLKPCPPEQTDPVSPLATHKFFRKAERKVEGNRADVRREGEIHHPDPD